VLTQPSSEPEPAAVAITRLICLTLVTLAVLIGGGLLLILYPEHANVAFALIGVVIGASLGLVSARPRRGH